jgi:hypothetical protein
MKKLLQVLIKTNNPTHTRTGLIIFTYIQNVLGEQTGEIIHDHLTVIQILPVLFSLDNFDVDLNFRLNLVAPCHLMC